MKKVRYAVVGTGYISQDAFMPSVDGTGNSCMTAIISGNPEGARKLADFYGIAHVYDYSEYCDFPVLCEPCGDRCLGTEGRCDFNLAF